MANKYSDALLSAIDILASKRVADAGYDKTIIAEVILKKKSKNNSYLLRYEDSLFEAFSKDEIPLHSMVYVLIPQGDMREEKQIIGVVSFYISNEDQVSSVSSQEQIVLWENTKGIILDNQKVVGFVDQNDQQIYFRDKEDTLNG